MFPLNRTLSRGGAESRLIVVYDEPQECPYLSGLTARMPLRLPVGSLDGEELDALLERGFRRTGDFVYRAECPSCKACEPTRVPVATFHWSRSLLRVLRRGDAALRMSLGPPRCDAERVTMFNRHRNERDMGRDDDSVDEEAYRAFLVESCCETLEMTFYLGRRPAAVAIVDVGKTSLSAVYTHFDPDLRRYSLGTYAILKQLQHAAATGRSMLYLGMYVATNRHLSYKARFVPQQRFIGGRWLTPA